MVAYCQLIEGKRDAECQRLRDKERDFFHSSVMCPDRAAYPVVTSLSDQFCLWTCTVLSGFAHVSGLQHIPIETDDILCFLAPVTLAVIELLPCKAASPSFEIHVQPRSTTNTSKPTQPPYPSSPSPSPPLPDRNSSVSGSDSRRLSPCPRARVAWFRLRRGRLRRCRRRPRRRRRGRLGASARYQPSEGKDVRGE